MVATQPSGASVWASIMRITPLDSLGNLLAGANGFVTNIGVKTTITPVVEAGDAIAIKNGGGDLAVYAKHGDIPKWASVSMELALVDPYLEQVLTGGVVLNDTSASLGLVTGTIATAQSTLGVLPAGTYVYQVSQYLSYGSTLPSTQVTATTTGTTGAVVLTGFTFAAAALGATIFGRIAGGVGKLGTIANVGTQATSAATGTGSPTTLSVTALTKPIPAGFTFQIAGDTNATKIVFTTTAAATVGATVLSVTVSQAIGTTIGAGNIVPCFVDTGATIPGAIPNTTDYSAGPGNNVGYQMGALGAVQNANGVAVEVFAKRIVNGVQATDYPYWRWVYPKICNLHVDARDHTNANTQSIYVGDAFQNPNFGSGPDGTWQFDSTKLMQRSLCGAEIVPVASVVPVTVGY